MWSLLSEWYESFETGKVVTTNYNHLGTKYHLLCLCCYFFLIFHGVKIETLLKDLYLFPTHQSSPHTLEAAKRNDKWLFEVLFHILFLFILNNERVMQSLRPQATPSHLSASLKRAVWESPILKSRRLGAVRTNWGSVIFWASVSPIVIGGYWTLQRNRKLDSSCMGEKKWLPVEE